MSTYKGIKGFTVKFLSADPPVAQEGQVFYNSTSSKLKVFTPTAGTSSWSTGDSLNVAQSSASGVGPNTASFIFGGQSPSEPSGANQSQSYNGSSWSTAPNMTYSQTAGFSNNDLSGNTSSLSAGGRITGNEGLTSSSSWNGTSWSSEATLPVGRRYGFSAGTGEQIIASNGLAASPPTAFPGDSNSYNGTAWSAAPALNTNRSNGACGGLFPAGIAIAGCRPPYCNNSNVVETWNATTWSTSPATYPSSTSLDQHSFAGGGMPSGGKYVDGANAFDWNGTTFSAGTAKSNTTITSSALSGTPTTAFAAGGSAPPGRSTVTELWTTTSPSVTAKDISLD